MQDLGTLSGSSSYTLAINGNREGYSYLADDTTTQAFTWTATGGMVDLGLRGTSLLFGCLERTLR
jgi:hypothetical protein